MLDYCTKDDIHTRLSDLSAEYDGLLDELCLEASRIFTVETGRRFDKTTATRYHSGRGTRTLFVPDIATLTTVRVRSSAQGSWRSVPLTPAEGNRKGDVLLGPEDRDADEPAGFLRLIDAPAGADAIWPAGDLTIEIAADWGYAAVPVDVRDATAELVIAMLRDRGVAVGGNVGVGELAQEGRVRTYPDLTYRIMQRRRGLLVA